MAYRDPDFDYRPKRKTITPKDNNTVLIISAAVLLVLVIIAGVIAYLAINGVENGNNKSKSPDSSHTTTIDADDEEDYDKNYYDDSEEEDKDIVVIDDEENEDDPQKESPEKQGTYKKEYRGSEFEEDEPLNAEPQVYYFVRKSWSDSSSQKGAFAVYDNAISCANQYSGQGYKVYDISGNLVYNPSPTPKNNSGAVMYRVRKSPGDSSSQIGAFADLERAVNLASSRSAEGYKVYDMEGNLIFAP